MIAGTGSSTIDDYNNRWSKTLIFPSTGSSTNRRQNPILPMLKLCRHPYPLSVQLLLLPKSSIVVIFKMSNRRNREYPPKLTMLSKRLRRGANIGGSGRPSNVSKQAPF
ncbi:hypothetical protein L1987_76931 [Smallanthus sonchifolius]|uniref:Uncharacterized protein n=1 Tax=Smallanthus sonchifolius TaxID=185202 RepID=A0ACB8Z7M1_9ASTR|nr:hypothetical protein L1987_76931 [Smallanthus sonchifolius]